MGLYYNIDLGDVSKATIKSLKKMFKELEAELREEVRERLGVSKLDADIEGNLCNFYHMKELPYSLQDVTLTVSNSGYVLDTVFEKLADLDFAIIYKNDDSARFLGEGLFQAKSRSFMGAKIFSLNETYNKVLELGGSVYYGKSEVHNFSEALAASKTDFDRIRYARTCSFGLTESRIADFERFLKNFGLTKDDYTIEKYTGEERRNDGREKEFVYRDNIKEPEPQNNLLQPMIEYPNQNPKKRELPEIEDPEEPEEPEYPKEPDMFPERRIIPEIPYERPLPEIVEPVKPRKREYER